METLWSAWRHIHKPSLWERFLQVQQREKIAPRRSIATWSNEKTLFSVKWKTGKWTWKIQIPKRSWQIQIRNTDGVAEKIWKNDTEIDKWHKFVDVWSVHFVPKYSLRLATNQLISPVMHCKRSSSILVSFFCARVDVKNVNKLTSKSSTICT